MSRKKEPTFKEQLAVLGDRVRPPVGIVLGSPGEAARLATSLPAEGLTAYQMDLHPAGRLRDALAEMGVTATVQTAADLWDLAPDFQTLVYPLAKGGERELKIDMIEQAYHTLRPHGSLVVLTPFVRDDFVGPLLKKVFGRVHAPTIGRQPVFWATRTGDRPRRRHEISFHVRHDETSLVFVSRPGTFTYGRLDDGARALMAVARIEPGDRVVDLGCGCGVNGVVAGRRGAGHVAFVDGNLRALALAELNARANGVMSFETHATTTVEGPKEGTFDVILANPPYFAQSSIAGLFTLRSRSLLKPGGRLHVVTKQAHEVGPMLEGVFGSVEAVHQGGYVVFTAHRAGRR